MPDQLLVSDANILIDIEVAGLTDAMFSLPYEYITPDSLFEQELREYHSELLEKGLILEELEPDKVERVQQLGQQYKGVSKHDLEALALAEDKNVPLLTGDKKLRQVCLEVNIDVRGTLWLVEQMLINGIITSTEAEIAYDLMVEDGSRLPWDEVEKQIKKWKKAEQE